VWIAASSMFLIGNANGQVADASSREYIEEILVTAERRAQSVQSIPSAISALSDEQLKALGIDSATTLQFGVPSVFVGDGSTQTFITIRGVGPTPQGQSGTSSVSVSVDGVYQSRTLAMGLAQVDLDRVEVLRGPQGTLYGRNATGGAINFITKAPTDAFEAKLAAGYSEYDQSHMQAIMNLPMGDRVRTRFAVDYTDRRDGFIENINPGREDVNELESLAARLRVTADLTDDLTVDMGLSSLKNEGTWTYFSQLGTPIQEVIDENPVLLGATYYPGQSLTVSENDRNDATREFDTASLTFTWDSPIGTLKSITAYQEYDSDYSNDGDGLDISYAPSFANNTNETYSQELALSGSTGGLSWVVGAFYSHENDSLRFNLAFPLGIFPFPPGVYIDFLEPGYTQKSYAAFADLTYSLSEKIDLIAGVRYTEDEQSATHSSSFGVAVGGVQIPIGDICSERTDKLESDSTTPRFGLQYNISSEQMAYVKYSKGYKAGGVDVYSCGGSYEPEEVESYEIGYKTQLFDRSVTLNVSAFHYEYTDFQVAQIVNLTLAITNAGGADVNGIELEGMWVPNEHWRLNASLSYIDAYYTEFFNLDGLNPQLGMQDLEDNQLNGSPKESANVGASYTTETYSWGTLTAAVNSSYRSRTYFREFNSPEDSQESFTLTNVNLVWTSPSEKYQARLFARNITDEHYYQLLGASDGFGTRTTASWGAPRQVGFEVSAQFE
jgi:iron complex outermembrane receptor protein